MKHKQFPPAYHQKLEGFAAEQKEIPSPAELAIREWMLTRGFKWQFVLAPFIADFYHPDLRLVVEVDGKFHEAQKDKDFSRTAYLTRRYSVKVIRCTAADCFSGKAVIELAEFIAKKRLRAAARRRKRVQARIRRQNRPAASPLGIVSDWSRRAAKPR